MLGKILLSWSALKKIRTLRVLRYSSLLLIVIPIYAAAHSMLAQNGILIPLPLNLFALYFACLFFYVAFFVFDLRCPRLIAENSSVYTFVETCLAHDKYCWDYRFDLEQRLEDIVKKVKADQPKADPQKMAAEFFNTHFRIEEEKQLKSIWEKNNGDRMVARSLCTLFVFLAGSLTVWISVVDAPARVIQSFRSEGCATAELGTHLPTWMQHALRFPLACPPSPDLGNGQ